MRFYFLRRWRADQSGAAAVELAMVAPILAGMAVVSFGIWQTGVQNQDARAALDVAAEYYMNGGTNDTTAASLALSAWSNKPADGAVHTVRSYRCGDIPAIITTVCSGGRTPGGYVTITAIGTMSVSLGQPTISIERVVRVR